MCISPVLSQAGAGPTNATYVYVPRPFPGPTNATYVYLTCPFTYVYLTCPFPGRSWAHERQQEAIRDRRRMMLHALRRTSSSVKSKKPRTEQPSVSFFDSSSVKTFPAIVLVLFSLKAWTTSNMRLFRSL